MCEQSMILANLFFYQFNKLLFLIWNLNLFLPFKATKFLFSLVFLDIINIINLQECHSCRICWNAKKNELWVFSSVSLKIRRAANFFQLHQKFCLFLRCFTCRKIISSNTSRLEAHAGLFRLLMKGIFEPYVLWLFEKKLIF